MPTDPKTLLDAAVKARHMAYTPYSNFKVGAALLASDGQVFTGCNIENASYGATNCAERTAIFKAVSEGVTSFEAIAIVGGSEDGELIYCPPCGICRQVMSEFCDPDFKIILMNGDHTPQCFTLADLLPESFTL